MQYAVQIALADKLATLSSLVSWLGDGADGILAEGDADPDRTKSPFLEIEFDGSRPTAVNGEEVQTWTVRLYQRDRGYLEIEQKLSDIRQLLHGQLLTVDSSATGYVLTDGVKYMGFTPRGYAYAFGARTEAVRFDVRCFSKSDN
jgi:hypothetical protein